MPSTNCGENIAEKGFGSSGRIRTYNPSVNSIVPGLCTSVFQCYRLLITRMLRVQFMLSPNVGVRSICRPFEGVSLQKSLHYMFVRACVLIFSAVNDQIGRAHV